MAFVVVVVGFAFLYIHDSLPLFTFKLALTIKNNKIIHNVQFLLLY
jgi:hypothetical protein